MAQNVEDSLSRHGERDVSACVHPVCTEAEGSRSGFDAGDETRTSVGDAARHPLRLEGAVEIVDVAGHVAAG